MLGTLLAIVLLLFASALAVRFYMGRAAEDELRPGERVAIRELGDPIPGNAFLACPPDYCTASAAPSPVFALPVERVAQLWRRILAGEPNIVTIGDEPAQHRLVVIQHTPLLRFPDIIAVEFVALGPDRSSLAIYSRARYGKSDFGTNRKRVLAWLGQLQIAAGQ